MFANRGFGTKFTYSPLTPMWHHVAHDLQIPPSLDIVPQSFSRVSVSFRESSFFLRDWLVSKWGRCAEPFQLTNWTGVACVSSSPLLFQRVPRNLDRTDLPAHRAGIAAAAPCIVYRSCSRAVDCALELGSPVEILSCDRHLPVH